MGRILIFPVGGFISDGGPVCLKIRFIEWYDDAGKMEMPPGLCVYCQEPGFAWIMQQCP